jgi:outer membrane protein TolC
MEKASSQSDSIAPDLNSLVVRDWQYDEEQSLQMAFKNNENLKQLELQKGIATDSANQTRGAILPTIGFLGYVTYQGTDASGEHSGLLSNYAGLQLTWNLFDGYITKNQAISSDRQAASYAAQLDEAKSQLRLQVRGKLLALRNTKRQIDIALNDIKHTEAIREDLKSRERFGLTTRSQVLQAEQQSHESKLQLISSITSYIVTYTELSNLCGVSPLS